ncbi:MAG: hypothetical protein ABI462_08000 [Ignavibacteria bacterium]
MLRVLIKELAETISVLGGFFESQKKIASGVILRKKCFWKFPAGSFESEFIKTEESL